MKNFGVEMYRFTDCDRERARYVNMLHLDTDLGVARPKMDRIVKFMGRWGYTVDVESDLRLYNDREMFLTGRDTDMLVLGSDAARRASAYYVLWCVGAGWFGIMPYWDVLWYDTGRVPEPNTERLKPHMGSVSPPLCSGPQFALDGICLAHAHIRRRDDKLALLGAYASMLGDIEGHITGLMPRARKMRSMSKKFEAFKTKVVKDRNGGPDIGLFFAALDVLRDSRNAGIHLVKNMPPAQVDRKRRRNEALLAYFERLADIYRRPLWPPVVSSRADSYLVNKWEFTLAHMAATWLAEYSELSVGS